MDDFSNSERTWMCSIIFLDIVKYSSQSCRLQIEWKRRFNHYLQEALSDVPEPQRIILDTGDGAVICFLGGPDTAVGPALELRRAFIEDKREQPQPMRIRMGINLGPVQLVKDINGHLNALGDGINAGQRVMSFAGDSEILVSRSFYEVVSCLCDSYRQMFRFVGAKKDKHSREHVLYQLVPAAEGNAGAPEVAESSAPTAPQLDAAVIDRLQVLLSPAVGPIARHLIQDASPRHADLSDLCSDLATQILGDKERTIFLEQCRKQFGSAVLPASSIAAKAPPPGEATSAVVWDPAILENAKKELAVYIGPMAEFLVDCTASQVHTVKEFYEALCAEIPSVRDRERFVMRCKPLPCLALLAL